MKDKILSALIGLIVLLSQSSIQLAWLCHGLVTCHDRPDRLTVTNELKWFRYKNVESNLMKKNALSIESTLTFNLRPAIWILEPSSLIWTQWWTSIWRSYRTDFSPFNLNRRMFQAEGRKNVDKSYYDSCPGLSAAYWHVSAVRGHWESRVNVWGYNKTRNIDLVLRTSHRKQRGSVLFPRLVFMRL